MKRCTLCGGRLDSSKRCTFCGLDNTKNDDMYRKMINRNNCSDMPLTHVHEEPVKATPKSVAPTYQAKKVQGQNVYVPKTSIKKVNTAKPKGCLASVVTFIPIIIAVIGILGSLLDDIRIGQSGSEHYAEEEMVALPEDFAEGYEFSTMLECGEYIVGYDLPAGTYSVYVLGDMDEALEIYDAEGYLYHWIEGEADSNFEVTLFDEYSMLVPESVVIELYTDNAQPLILE